MQSYFIWGMGLLGTSLALDLKARGHQVAGVSGSEQDVQTLKNLGFSKVFVLGKNHREAAEIIASCHGVIIATPAKAVVEVLRTLRTMRLPPDLWITDVSSAKRELMQDIENETRQENFINFVGSHPMAGSDLSGPQHAYHNMFIQATVFITPLTFTANESAAYGQHQESYRQALQQVKDFWLMLGGHPFEVAYAVHDKWAAYLSHGLHLVSCMIPLLMNDIPEIFAMPHGPAGGSFRDISRVAGSNPQLWKNILESNRQEVTSYLKRLSELSQKWQQQLADSSLSIVEIFEEADNIRKRLISHLPPAPPIDSDVLLSKKTQHE